MGMLLRPVFERPVEISSEATGEFLAAFLGEIESAADKFGLTPLSAFADNRPVPEGFDGDPDELEELMGSCNDWYDPAQGKQAITALADAVVECPEDLGFGSGRSGVAAELRNLAAVLANAVAETVRFRLELQ